MIHRPMRVLIAGAGIAGPTLAYWLVRRGFEVTLVERAPALRRGGYVIDFWGPGVRRRGHDGRSRSGAPTSQLSMLVRNVALGLLDVPRLGERMIVAMLRTRCKLPRYGS